MEKDDDIMIKSTREWYYPYDTVDSLDVKAKWNVVVSLSRRRGKSGLRVFADMSGIFKAGLSKDLVA
ncbi:hypothetical protein [Nitrososphaera sp.]|uniref:hypothetical protein n=1 Tax=Nitrososphaera sp. TaxID=1971748 RepID=UPI002ED839A3